jgi:hypothetical protein
MPPFALPHLLRCLLLGLLLSGCSGQHVDREQMLASIEARSQLPDSHYNLLWYQGTSRDQHHFKHIRGYFLDEVIFIVDAQQLPIAQPRAYSRHSTRWLRVERIGDRWQAARKHADQGWQVDRCLREEHECLRLD